MQYGFGPTYAGTEQLLQILNKRLYISMSSRSFGIESKSQHEDAVAEGIEAVYQHCQHDFRLL